MSFCVHCPAWTNSSPNDDQRKRIHATTFCKSPVTVDRVSFALYVSWPHFLFKLPFGPLPDIMFRINCKISNFPLTYKVESQIFFICDKFQISIYSDHIMQYSLISLFYFIHFYFILVFKNRMLGDFFKNSRSKIFFFKFDY